VDLSQHLQHLAQFLCTAAEPTEISTAPRSPSTMRGTTAGSVLDLVSWRVAKNVRSMIAPVSVSETRGGTSDLVRYVAPGVPNNVDPGASKVGISRGRGCLEQAENVDLGARKP
jgi:hypothetical protein